MEGCVKCNIVSLFKTITTRDYDKATPVKNKLEFHKKKAYENKDFCCGVMSS